MRIAIFDIGTNSIHMLVVEIRKNLSFEILNHERDTTRLGDGSFETRRLGRERSRRALEIIERFSQIAKKNHAQKMFGIATSAVRDAKNGRQFIRSIYKRTKAKIQIISGEEEGRLIFLGARSGMNAEGKKTLVIDIGGGSIELILGDGRQIYFNKSFKLGVARLTDHFIKNDPPSKKEIRRLRKFINEEIEESVEKIRGIGFSKVIGTAGTMINLAAMVFENEKSQPFRLVKPFELKKKSLNRVHEKLTKRNLRELLKMPGLDLKRADIITAGSVLVTSLMRQLKVNRIWISNKGVREGALLDYIVKSHVKTGKRRPEVHVQWFGQKPFFSGRISLSKRMYATI